MTPDGNVGRDGAGKAEESRSWETTGADGQTYPHHVVHSVDVRVAHVDTDGPQGEAILLASSVDDDGGPGVAEGWQEVPARRRVPG